MHRRGFTLKELLVVLAICTVLLALATPFAWLAELPFTLALGWVKYLWRVLPNVNPDPWTVGTALACLVGVVLGAHLFLRWLARSAAAQPAAPRWPFQRTLRLVGLVVLMFVAGIAIVGMIHQTSWLVRSPEPLTDGGIRRVAARMASANHLKQIGLAAHNHLDDTKPPELPRSSFTATGQPLHSWQTALLPYIEQDALYKQIDRTKPWTDPANAGPMGVSIKTYLNPAIATDRASGVGASHYAGNVAVVLGDAKKFDSFPAGASNTILAGEVSSNFRAWGDPLNVRDPRSGSRGPNGRPAQFVLLDGSVRTFDTNELAELMSKAPE